MSQTIKLKRSAVEGKLPTTSSLELGEVAINTYDGKVYLKKDDGVESIQTIVVTDSKTTGSVDISGSIIITGSLSVTDGTTTGYLSSSYIDLDVLANGEIPPYKAGRIFFGAEDGALSVYNEEADITLQVGQEFYVRVYNATTSSILNGTPVRISGSQGDRPKIYPALAEDHSTGPVFDNHIIGVATHDIEASSEGYVTAQGIVRDVDTTGFAEGDILFLQTGSAGYRNTPPPFPYDVVQVGFATRIPPGGSTAGAIFVEPKEPVHFSNISGLSGSYTATTGDLWVYQSNNAWTHTNILPDIIATGSFSGSFVGTLTGTATTASNITPAISASADNRVLTDDGDGTLTAEANLTFDGTDLAAPRLKVGTGHTLTGTCATIAGGSGNTASGNCSTVSGGRCNTASGGCSTVGGGFCNTASGVCSTVAGGRSNIASGTDSSMGGGYYNNASGDASNVGGGILNNASGAGSTIGGGNTNTASGDYSPTVAGGDNNTASGDASNVGGGYQNTASGNYSTVGGGCTNTASGNYSGILGGKSNHTCGYADSFIIGSNLCATAACTTFVNNLDVSGNTTIDGILTVNTNELYVSGSRVGIGTNNPSVRLDIQQNSTYNLEPNSGIRIFTDTSTTGILIGADPAISASYIQALDPGTSFITRPLLLMPNGGVVGIGTTTPSTATLTVNGSISGSGNLKIAGDLDVNGNSFFVNSSTNRVGIATSTPASVLDINTTDSTVWNSLWTSTDGFTPKAHELSIQNGQDATSGSFAGIFFKAGETSLNSQINAARIAAVREAGFDTALVFANRSLAAGGMAETMRITAAGNVGIGTTNPTQKLTVSGSISAAGNLLPDANNIRNIGSPSLFWKEIFVSTGSINFVDPVTEEVVQTLSANAEGLTLTQGVINGTFTGDGSNLQNIATASFALTASYALNAEGGSGAGFPFEGDAEITGSLNISGNTILNGNLTVDTNTLHVDSSNNRVGIGTISPTRNLDLESESGTSVGIQLNSTAAGGRSYSFFSTNNGSSLGGGKFGFYDDTAQASRFTIDSLGNIGIGTTSPSQKLTVAGNISGTGNLVIDGTLTANGGITGSLLGTAAIASYVEFSNVANKPTLVSGSSQINHDSTTGFVSNEHIDHSGVSITAGSGLSGGGNITATRTLSVDSGSMLPYYSSSIFSQISGDITINSSTGVASIAANSVALGTDTTGNYVGTITAGTGIDTSGATTGEGIAHTISVDVSDFMTNGSNNRVVTATGTDGMNAEANLTFDGTDLTAPRLKVGTGHTLTGTCATIAGGCTNTASACYSTVGGGYCNTAGGGRATVGGGCNNTASGCLSAVGGGRNNTANGCISTVSGGRGNTASAYLSTVSGGYANTTSCNGATVGGGSLNTASGNTSTIGGGYGNTASSVCSTVSGGRSNTASCFYSTIGGGACNTASGNTSTVGGGFRNTSSAFVSTVGGGYCNTASGSISTVSGGYRNTASGLNSTVSGGYCNITNARHSTINGGHRNIIQSPTNECCSRGVTIGGGVGHNSSGGTLNSTTGDLTGTITCCNAGRFSTISGGLRNCATGVCSTVGGGNCNTASGACSTVGGGSENTAGGGRATVSGGYCNTASACYSTIGGGVSNTASGYYSTVDGGSGNTASGDYSTVGGGENNTASGTRSTVGGGCSNTASGGCSTVGGGQVNTASGNYSGILGGKSNHTCGYADSFIVGSNLCATAACTTFVNNLTTAGTVTAGTVVETSSERYKENIQPLTQSLEKTLKLEGVSFTKKGQQKTEIGLIAEKVQSLYPEIILHNSNGEIEGLEYSRITAILVEAIKELHTKVFNQQIFIEELQERISNLEKK